MRRAALIDREVATAAGIRLLAPAVGLAAVYSLVQLDDESALPYYSSLIATLSLVGPLLTGGGGSALLAAKGDFGEPEGISASARGQLLVLLLPSAALLLVAQIVPRMDNLPLSVVALSALLFFDGVRSIAFTQARRDSKYLGAVALSEPMRNLAIYAAVVLTFGNIAVPIAPGPTLLLSSVFCAASLLIATKGRPRFQIERPRNEIAQFGVPAMLGLAISTIEVPVVVATYSSTDSSAYVVALRLAALASLPVGVAGLWLQPKLRRILDDRAIEALLVRSSRATFGSAAMLTPIAAGGLLVPGFDGLESGAWLVLAVLLAAGLFNVALGPSILTLTLLNDQRWIRHTAVTFLPTYVVGLLLVSQAGMGIGGFAVASALGTAVFNLLAWSRLLRQFGIRSDIAQRRTGAPSA